MRMFSRQLLLILVLGLSQSPWVHALGFGELRLNSGLNQPLDAEIPLYDTGTLNASQLLVKLASPEAFERLGVERFFFLTRLKFAVNLDGRGGGVIQVTSRDAVREPYLDFIIEAHWPSGRIQREYTVLLDIPQYSDRAAAPVQVTRRPSSEPSNNQAQSRSIPSRSSRGPRPRQGDDRRALPSVDGEGRYRVQHNDTLADIARRARPSNDVSIEQVMLALQRNNPRAFIGGNVNRLKSGYVLNYPNAAEARRVSAPQAREEVARQTAIWRGRSAPSQPQYALQESSADPEPAPSAGGSASRSEASEPAGPRGRLSIAAGEGSGEGVGDGNVEKLSLRDQLAASQENLDRIARQNSELKGRLQDMERQLQTLQRLLELKDEQLAALQAGIGAAPDDESGDAPADGSDEATNEAGVQPEPELPLWREILTAGQTLAVRLWNSGDEALKEQGVEPAPLRAAVLLIPLLLILWLLIRAARSGSSRHSNEEEVAAPVVDPVAVPLVTAGVAAGEAEQSQGESLDEATADLRDEAPKEAEDESSAAEPDDVPGLNDEAPVAPPVVPEASAGIDANEAVAEAGMYIAYRHFEQAKGLLSAALKQHPDHAGLLEKKAELAIEQQDHAAFTEARSALVALGAQRELERIEEHLDLRDLGAEWSLANTAAPGSGSAEEPSDFASAETEQLEHSFDELQASEAGSEIDTSALSLDDEPSETESSESEDEQANTFADQDMTDAGQQSESSALEFPAASAPQAVQPVEEQSEEKTSAADDFEFDLDLSDLELEDDLPMSSDKADTESVAGSAEDDGPSFRFDEPLENDDEDPTFGDLDFDLEDRFDRVGEFSSLDKEGDDADGLKPDSDPSMDQQLEPAAVFDDLEDDGISLLSDEDDVTQKLNLARAYIELGESHSARDMLKEVLNDGDDEQREQAQQLLAKL